MFNAMEIVEPGTEGFNQILEDMPPDISDKLGQLADFERFSLILCSEKELDRMDVWFLKYAFFGRSHSLFYLIRFYVGSDKSYYAVTLL
jgi:hypothetical protein